MELAWDGSERIIINHNKLRLRIFSKYIISTTVRIHITTNQSIIFDIVEKFFPPKGGVYVAISSESVMSI